MRHALTILSVADLERSAAFYDAAFGWPRRVDVPVYVEYGLPDGARVGLYQRDALASIVGRPPEVVPSEALVAAELYLHVADPAAAAARLLEAGATPLSPLGPRGWGDEAAYLRSPEGHILVVARPLGVESPEATARRWMTAWQGADPAVLRTVHADDFVDHDAAGRATDTAAFEAGVRSLYAAFPDFHADIDDLLVTLTADGGARVTVRWHAQATQRGAFLGVAPTGRRVAVRGIELLTIVEGRVRARWGHWDGLGLRAQLAEDGSDQASAALEAALRRD